MFRVQDLGFWMEGAIEEPLSILRDCLEHLLRFGLPPACYPMACSPALLTVESIDPA